MSSALISREPLSTVITGRVAAVDRDEVADHRHAARGGSYAMRLPSSSRGRVIPVARVVWIVSMARWLIDAIAINGSCCSRRTNRRFVGNTPKSTS